MYDFEDVNYALPKIFKALDTGGGDIVGSVFYVILKYPVIKGSYNVMGRIPSRGKSTSCHV